MATFKDYIPEDEDPGASTTAVFVDFVPTPEPQPVEVPDEEVAPGTTGTKKSTKKSK